MEGGLEAGFAHLVVVFWRGVGVVGVVVFVCVVWGGVVVVRLEMVVARLGWRKAFFWLGGARLRVGGLGIWPAWLWGSTTLDVFGIIVLFLDSMIVL